MVTERVGERASEASVLLLLFSILHVSSAPSSFNLMLVIIIAISTGFTARFFAHLDTGDINIGTGLVILYGVFSIIVLSLLILDALSCSGVMTISGISGCSNPLFVFAGIGGFMGCLGYFLHFIIDIYYDT